MLNKFSVKIYQICHQHNAKCRVKSIIYMTFFDTTIDLRQLRFTFHIHFFLKCFAGMIWRGREFYEGHINCYWKELISLEEQNLAVIYRVIRCKSPTQHRITCNQFHNILRLLDVLPNIPYSTSELMRDYYV